MKRHHDHGSVHKEKHSIGAGFHLRGLAHCQQARKHGGMQTDIVLEKELGGLHQDPQATGRERVTGPDLGC